MDIIRLIVQIVFVSFFYWFIFSVVRALERDLGRPEDKAAGGYKAPVSGGD
ncbi:MAG: hypothetical protein GX952_02440 [Firmicutes bacterium]|nr:hypothetical protein [Bacillota bacterium]